MHIHNTHGLVERITALLLRILSVLLIPPTSVEVKREKRKREEGKKRGGDVSATEEGVLRKAEGPRPAKSKHYALWLNMSSHPGGWRL